MEHIYIYTYIYIYIYLLEIFIGDIFLRYPTVESYLIIICNIYIYIIYIYIHMRYDQQLDICVSPKLWDTIQISDD